MLHQELRKRVSGYDDAQIIEGNSVAEFLDRYYRPERYRGRDGDMPGYSESLLRSHEESFRSNGYDFISRHDSVTGKATYLFAPSLTIVEPETMLEAPRHECPVTEDGDIHFA